MYRDNYSGMNLVQNVLSRLSQFKEMSQNNDHSIYKNLLTVKRDEIIESLGGLDTLITLCLTNPNVTSLIDDNQLVSFEQILITNINRRNTINSSVNFITGNTNGNTSTNTMTNLYANVNANINNVNANTTTNTNGTTTTNNINFVDNAKEYNKLQTIINTHETNCLCYKIFSNHPEIAQRLFQALTNKTKVGFLLSFIVLMFIGGQVARILLGNDNIVRYILVQTAFILSIIAFSLELLICNLEIIYLIIQTFDFWFKFVNIISLLISFGIVYDVPNWYKGFILSVILVTFMFVFVVDSMPIATRVKRIVLLFFTSFLIYAAGVVYFTSSDVTWNPFEKYHFEHSRISFKSIVISSCINLALFVCKSQIFDYISNLKHKIRYKCCTKYRNKLKEPNYMPKNLGVIKDYQKCHTVHHKPYLKWTRLSS